MEHDQLATLRIAAPCPASWDEMAGDERVRHCAMCSLNVYNFAEMTRAEVRELLVRTEGRICARLYRRADGTVLTRDCPVGLRAVRRRVSKMAGAALKAVFSLFSGAFSQTQSQEDKTCTQAVAVKTKKTAQKDEQGTINGVVTDKSGGVIPGAKVTLINEQSGDKLKSISTKEGTFKFSNLVAGEYTLEIEAAGFNKSILTNLKVNSDEVVEATLTLELKGASATMGVVALEEPIENGNG